MTDKTERPKGYKAGVVLLWGRKKIDPKALEEYIKSGQYEEEEEQIQQPEKPTKKTARQYDPNETYEFKDIDFLKSEMKKAEDAQSNPNLTEEEYEKYLDIESEIHDLIQQIEELHEKFGSGIGPIRVEAVDLDSDDKEDIIGSSVQRRCVGRAIGDDIYKCPLCKVEFADKTKMKRHLTTKKHLDELAKVANTEAEKTKINEEILTKERKGRSDKDKIRKEKKSYELKPYFRVGKVPSGYREARQDEALKAGKFSEFGKYEIKPEDLKDFEILGSVYQPDLTETEITPRLMGLKGRLKRIIKDYNYIPHGYNKFDKEKKKEREDLRDKLKQQFEVLERIINKYYKDYQTLKGKPYQKLEFDISPPEVVKQVHSIKYEPEEEEPKERPQKVYITFESEGKPDLQISESQFENGKTPYQVGTLKSKYAKKLYQMNIRLEKEFYTPEDYKEYFFTKKEKKGGMLGIYNYYMDYRQKNRTFTTKVQKLLKRYGDENIQSIVINRTPVQAFITPVLNTLTLGDFKKKLAETPYDKLYHLRLEINGRYTIEKNEVINMDSPVPPAQPDTQKRTITTGYKPALTLNKMIANAIKGMGQFDFFNYSATKNNCQDFCIGLLKYSGIGNKEDYDFIKQDVETVFKGYPTLSKFMDKLTGFAGEARTLIGGDLRPTYSNVQSVLFSRPHWTEETAVKWLKKHQYTGLIVDKKPEHLRYRQEDPEMLKQQGYYFRTLVLPKGIELIIAYKPSIQHLEKPLKRYHD